MGFVQEGAELRLGGEEAGSLGDDRLEDHDAGREIRRDDDADARLVDHLAKRRLVRRPPGGADDKIDPDLYKRFTGLTKFGVEAYLCEITFKRNKIDLAKAKKDSFLKFVPSGVAEITRLQQREGYAYLRP